MHRELPAPAWAWTPEEALARLHSKEDGLTEAEADARLRRNGTNALPRARRFDILGIAARQFSSPLIFILIGAAVLTVLLKEWTDTVVIVLAILVNALLGFYQEFRAEGALEKLTTYIKERTRVVRGGAEEEIDSVLIVPGDIIRLSWGARVPADARILAANDLTLDESVLTGESLPVRKDTTPLSEGAPLAERSNMAFAGTLVAEGSASALVTATGAATEIGRIAELVSTVRPEATPLQRALARLGWFIFAGVLALAGVIFLLGIARGIPPVEMMLMTASVAVGAIPEALPIALTVILAAGAVRLAGRKAILRHLAAAETLGSASVIMTDKTGTLTEADMRLVDIRMLGELLKETAPRSSMRLDAAETELLASALWGADVALENPEAPKAERRFIGRPIEAAIARAAAAQGIDIDEAKRGRATLLPFNSTNKFSIAGGAGRFVAVGAPDILLRRARLTKDDYLAVEARIEALGGEGKRLLGIARLPHEQAEALSKGAPPEKASDMEFLGILVFEDPLRPEAKRAVERMERLGARVIMLTGDLKGTAVAVARQLGWTIDEGAVLTGDEIRQLSDEALIASLPRLRVFARVTPEDKLRIGTLLQRTGEIVAMTGDGVNDAPSLKAVNIGIALGSGTDVAKSVADIVLLDDDFLTIDAAIEEGRRILENIRKVFVYLASTCLDAVILIGGSLLIGLPLPLTSLQIIWVNFFTDSLPALSFAFDKEYGSRRAETAILTREVKLLTIGIGLLTSLLLFCLYWFMLSRGIDGAAVRSVIFACFSLYGLVIAYSFRSLRRSIFSFPVFDNRALNWSVAIGIALIFASLLLPFMRSLLELAPIPPALAWVILAWLVFNVGIVEAAKWAMHAFARSPR